MDYQHHRRTVVRVLFQGARQLDPPGSTGSRRRAVPAIGEAAAARSRMTRWSPVSSRPVTPWTPPVIPPLVLAQATATAGERAVQRRTTSTWTSAGCGCADQACERRAGSADDWGVEHLRRRIDDLDGSDPRLVHRGSGKGSGSASSCAAIADILLRTGLCREPDLTPTSVSSWAGRRTWNRPETSISSGRSWASRAWTPPTASSAGQVDHERHTEGTDAVTITGGVVDLAEAEAHPHRQAEGSPSSETAAARRSDSRPNARQKPRMKRGRRPWRPTDRRRPTSRYSMGPAVADDIRHR